MNFVFQVGMSRASRGREEAVAEHPAVPSLMERRRRERYLLAQAGQCVLPHPSPCLFHSLPYSPRDHHHHQVRRSRQRNGLASARPIRPCSHPHQEEQLVQSRHDRLHQRPPRTRSSGRRSITALRRSWRSSRNAGTWRVAP